MRMQMTEDSFLQQRKARKIIDAAQDALDWLTLYGPEYGVSDEVADELRFRLQHIVAVARTMDMAH